MFTFCASGGAIGGSVVEPEQGSFDVGDGDGVFAARKLGLQEIEAVEQDGKEFFVGSAVGDCAESTSDAEWDWFFFDELDDLAGLVRLFKVEQFVTMAWSDDFWHIRVGVMVVGRKVRWKAFRLRRFLIRVFSLQNLWNLGLG